MHIASTWTVCVWLIWPWRSHELWKKVHFGIEKMNNSSTWHIDFRYSFYLNQNQISENRFSMTKRCWVRWYILFDRLLRAFLLLLLFGRSFELLFILSFSVSLGWVKSTLMELCLFIVAAKIFTQHNMLLILMCVESRPESTRQYWMLDRT